MIVLAVHVAPRDPDDARIIPGGEVVIRDGERHLESVYKRPLSVY